jgi:hypothetical protein
MESVVSTIETEAVASRNVSGKTCPNDDQSYQNPLMNNDYIQSKGSL